MISFTDKMVNGKIVRRDPVRLDGKPDKSVFERIGRQFQDGAPLLSEDAVRREILKPQLVAEDAWQLSGMAINQLRTGAKEKLFQARERREQRQAARLVRVQSKTKLMPRLRMRMLWW